jgi:imidazole glycerol-phosphate synthase subunit HisF
VLRPRIIPCLLIHKGGLVKTQGFKDPKYIGDPINAVKIFNEKEADELMVLDIDASMSGTEPNYQLIEKLAAECRMPLCYGGGISNWQQAARIIGLGVEKVSVSAAAVADPGLLTRMSEALGRQSVVAVLDVRKRSSQGRAAYEVFTHNGGRASGRDPVALAIALQEAGAGEIVVNSIDRDGQMGGYDLDLAGLLRPVVNVPLTVLGGAGSLTDMQALVRECGVVGVAAGSLFVFKGKFRAVLINYPSDVQKESVWLASVNRETSASLRDRL